MIWPEDRGNGPNPPQAFPLLQTAAAIPDTPGNLSGTPQLETTPQHPPLSFSSPETMMLRLPRPPSVPTSLAYKSRLGLAMELTPPTKTPQTSSSALTHSRSSSPVKLSPQTTAPATTCPQQTTSPPALPPVGGGREELPSPPGQHHRRRHPPR
jgi:hypothetical protein